MKSRDVIKEEGLRLHFCSQSTVSFNDGGYGYLYLSGNKISDILYRRNGDEHSLFTENDNPSPALIRQDDSYYKAYQIKALESPENFADVYRIMCTVKDYAGICSLSEGVEYSDEMQIKWQESKDSIAFEGEIKTTEYRSCYKMIIDQNNNGVQTQEERYLYIKKGEHGWYAENLPQDTPQPDSWWEN